MNQNIIKTKTLRQQATEAQDKSKETYGSSLEDQAKKRQIQEGTIVVLRKYLSIVSQLK